MEAISSTSSPCGACKFLRRKCVADCVFAPSFSSKQGLRDFAAIHKVFGASNVSKLLLNLPVHARYQAAITIAYEAQARIHDPVYGCVAHIFALQQQVAYLQAQVMQEKAQLASSLVNNGSLKTNNFNFHTENHHNQQYWNLMAVNSCSNPVSPQSSLESIDQINEINLAFDLHKMGELQELALQMIRN